MIKAIINVSLMTLLLTGICICCINSGRAKQGLPPITIGGNHD